MKGLSLIKGDLGIPWEALPYSFYPIPNLPTARFGLVLLFDCSDLGFILPFPWVLPIR